MAKEALYFPHDGNARNDDKMIAVRMRHGAEGYAIYFMILERLFEGTNYMSLKDYNVIAFELRVSADKVKSVIEDFGLFQFADDGKRFYSESLNRRMEPLNRVREQRRLAGKASAELRQKKAEIKELNKTERPFNDRSTTVEEKANDRSTGAGVKSNRESKESKVNKVDDDEKDDPPSSPTPAEDHPFLSPAQIHLGSPIDECLKMYFESKEYQMTRDQVAISKHMSVQTLRRWGEVFRKHLISQGQTHKTMGDFAKHFRQWIKFQSGDPAAAEKKLFNIDTPSKDDDNTAKTQLDSWNKSIERFQKRLSGTTRQGAAE